MIAATRQSWRPREALVAAALVLFSISATAHATIVGAQSDGDDMAGGSMSVFFQNTGVIVAPIVPGLPGEGMASAPELFDFSVTGDTFISDWMLVNQTTSDFIIAVVFNLEGSAALFDDGSIPSTPNGDLGRAGAVQVNVDLPAITLSHELVPWADAMNTGDEFIQEEIFYANFGPGMTSIWRDDTDIIGVDTPPELPEPSSATLLLAAVGFISVLRRRPTGNVPRN